MSRPAKHANTVRLRVVGGTAAAPIAPIPAVFRDLILGLAADLAAAAAAAHNAGDTPQPAEPAE